MYCLVCGRKIKEREMIRHLNSHRLGKEDLIYNQLFSRARYLKYSHFKVSKNRLCPYCKKRNTSPVIYGVFNYYRKEKGDFFFLVKCPDCKKLYVVPVNSRRLKIHSIDTSIGDVI